jgi:hypothetical protein
MNRVLLATVALAAFVLGLHAEEPAAHLNVQPMTAPKPALKYQLLPEVRELNPGNPAQNYVKCFMEQQNFFFSKGAAEERAGYLAVPLAELPADRLRQYGGAALTQADWAARLDTPDWQILQRLQSDGLDMQVPEVGNLRVLADALQVRFRAQVAGRHFDEAVGSAKTMFGLARHLGELPTVAANRVGLSIAEQALDTVEEMVQQPGCPNLYWALTDLPCPVVDLRKGVQGDRTLVAADLRLLHEEPLTEAEVEKIVRRLSGVMSFARQQAGEAPRGLRAALQTRIRDSERLRAARSRLVEAGCKEEIIQKLPPVQVVLLDEKREYEARRDERLKLLALAPWQMDALAGEEQGSGDGLFADLLPDIRKVRWAQGRLEQRVALLRHVEALRLYAAAHDGKLPEKLADVCVPLPDDPFSGKPFVYRVESATAHLCGIPPRAEEKNSSFNGHYAVTIQK